MIQLSNRCKERENIDQSIKTALLSTVYKGTKSSAENMFLCYLKKPKVCYVKSQIALRILTKITSWAKPWGTVQSCK